VSDYFYEPRHGHGLPHDPLNALIAPRPIGWIGSHDLHGKRNLAPFSFFNVVNYHPPILMFSNTAAHDQDTPRNIAETGEFSWNLVTRTLLPAANATSASGDVDEFVLAGVTPVTGPITGAPRVAESPVSMECRLIQQIALTAADGSPTPSVLTLGEVVGVHIEESLLVEGVYDTAAADPIVRGGGRTAYFALGDRLDLERPR
jgi:flavin reductase (DIM6/NTAB) family NADH-FMN oxidoreductase RutF